MTMLRNRPDVVSQLRPLKAADIPDLTDILPEPHVAVGIDGSMDYDEVLEMMLFYVAASGYRCQFSIDKKQISLDLLNAKRIEELFASSVVPLWEEDLLNVVRTSDQIESDVDFRRVMEKIPFALMAMAELYLAWKIVSKGDVRILFLDRPFSGTYPSLYRDLSLLMRRKSIAFEGLETREGRIERLDLYLGLGLGSGLAYVPNRGIYLPHAALRFLINNPEATKKQLAESLALDEEKAQSLLQRLRKVDERSGHQIIEKEDLESIQVSDRATSSWRRVKALAIEIADRIFNPAISVKHPLIMENGRWLCVNEINALNLFLLEALIEEAVNRKVLVIGIAKDTTATDFTRAALPTSLLLSKSEAKLPGLKSDKALLTILSTANAASLSTPWRTFTYDGCMATLIATPKADVKLRAARQMVSREQLFVRCYFQLRTFQQDPEIRAPVFLYDRLFLPCYDRESVHEMTAIEREKPVTLRFYMEDQGERSQIDDIILLILSASDNPEVLEAYGHNQLLYLADKYVKREVQLMKGLLKGVVDLELTPLARREKVFSIARRFRDLRAESEHARSQSAQPLERVQIR
jgi:CRP-like cAMP-binding protein